MSLIPVFELGLASLIMLLCLRSVLELKAEAGETKLMEEKRVSVKMKENWGKWQKQEQIRAAAGYWSQLCGFVLISPYYMAFSNCALTISQTLLSVRSACHRLTAHSCAGGWRCDVWPRHCVSLLLPRWTPEHNQADESQRGATNLSGIYSLWFCV